MGRAQSHSIRRQLAIPPSRSGGPIGSVVKAVNVLKVLSDNEIASVERLSRDTGIPKPSVLRIIGTLMQCGLVSQISRRAGYCLTSQALNLSAGYHGLPAVIEAGAPVAEMLTRELLWPAAITGFDGDAMVVRYSTMPHSPHAHVKSTINKRLSLTERAHGRAYLAFCGPTERETLLNIIAIREGRSTPAVSDHGKLLWALNSARRAGYAKRATDLDPKTSSIAAPIMVGTTVRATLGLTFFSIAVDRKTEAALGRRLIEAATTVADALGEIDNRNCVL